MKPFIFDERQYEDLDSLGLAFVNQFDLALQVIKEKEFVKFFKKFKAYKKQIQSILYQSRYLQNALSMIIYLVTEEHILYVGHRRYNTISSVLKDMKRNPSFRFFAEDHGFSYTIVPTLEVEKLKADLKAFEDCFTDDFSLDYFEGYMDKDSIETITSRFNTIPTSKDPFKEALRIFQSRQVQLALAYRYSLAQVLQMRKKPCPVFEGFFIVKGDMDLPLSILENAFYSSLLNQYKKFKYKKLEGKVYRNKLNTQRKAFKKYKKMSDTAKLNYQEKLHTLYLEWIDLFKLERILISDSNLEPTISYCDTYVNFKTAEDLMLSRDSIEKKYTPVLQSEYDLRKLEKSLKNHWYFSFWCLFITIVVGIGQLLFGLIPALRDLIFQSLAQLLDKKVDQLEELPTISNVLFFVGAGISIMLTITILVLRSLSKKKYNGLCRLAYYRKNEAILLEKEQADYEKLKLNEARYAKKIDRYYRFYGGISMAGLSLATTIATLSIVYVCGFVIQDSFAENVLSLLKNNLYFVFLGPGICLILGFARHKKTAWSVIFTYIMSVIAAVAPLFLKL